VASAMRIDWNVPIPMDDGVVLRADVFRPAGSGRYPAIVSYGPYAKGLAFQDGYPEQWAKLAEHADVLAGSTNKYQSWEVVDPEKWVPDGYVVVRVDSRGAGCSPGVVDNRSPRETHDFYLCIEWAAGQPWSDGKIGLCGISYYAINQWLVAGLQPPHLTAMIPWEGAADNYRDMNYHGGIYCDFGSGWFKRQVMTVQHGMGERARRNPNTGESVAGAVTLPEDELARNRVDRGAENRKHPLDDEWHRARSADWSKVEVPFLSAANWGGQPLHPRGNFEGFARAASKQKWLEVHGLEHWTHFYTRYGVSLQKRFFGYFLKGENNGWDRQPRVQLQIRHLDGTFVERPEREWPIARTQWTKWYLDAEKTQLARHAGPVEGRVEYDALGDGVTFSTSRLERETEITGPLAAKLFVASSTRDADLFLVIQVFDPASQEVVFQGAQDPHTPVAQGWLRASRRKLDPERSLPYRPYHTHDTIQPLTPGEVYELDVEIWPTCVVVPAGYRIALTIRGRDYEYEGVEPTAAWKGCGPFTHTDIADRPRDAFGGKVTVHAGGARSSYLLLPIIPPE
jgi:uncharacterized protein